VSTKSRHIFLGAAILTVTALVWPSANAVAEDSLFSTDEILEITIHGPLKNLTRSKHHSTGVTGRLELKGGPAIPVTISGYGVSRLEECDLPLFKIEIDEADARGTPFEGQPIVRLVTPCHQGSTWDRFVLFEYLAYRSYAILAEPALRARLVATRFFDSDRPAFQASGLSFFIEDITAAADRHDTQWLDIEEQTIEGLDPERLALLGLFQFMVANTDWSVVAAEEGKRCCHNVAILGAEDNHQNWPLPYDFDHAGLVNAPYATPSWQLPIKRVTQRLYRGFCVSNELLPAAIGIFNEKRPELERLFANNELPDRKTRKRAWKYIDIFFETINDPRRLENQIYDRCR
jgi:hypothetical protein